MPVLAISCLNILPMILSSFLKFIDLSSEQLLLFLCGISMKVSADKMLRMLIIMELAAIDAPVAEDLCTATFVTKLFLAMASYYMATTITLD
jgi:hypothetical protein